MNSLPGFYITRMALAFTCLPVVGCGVWDTAIDCLTDEPKRGQLSVSWDTPQNQAADGTSLLKLQLSGASHWSKPVQVKLAFSANVQLVSQTEVTLAPDESQTVAVRAPRTPGGVFAFATTDGGETAQSPGLTLAAVPIGSVRLVSNKLAVQVDGVDAVQLSAEVSPAVTAAAPDVGAQVSLGEVVHFAACCGTALCTDVLLPNAVPLTSDNKVAVQVFAFRPAATQPFEFRVLAATQPPSCNDTPAVGASIALVGVLPKDE